jgi:hypothetical protein
MASGFLTLKILTICLSIKLVFISYRALSRALIRDLTSFLLALLSTGYMWLALLDI